MNNGLITEREFVKNETEYLKALAIKIETFLEDFDLTCKYIAKQCNLDPRIVHRAARGIRLNGECERRISLMIDKYYEIKKK